MSYMVAPLVITHVLPFSSVIWCTATTFLSRKLNLSAEEREENWPRFMFASPFFLQNYAHEAWACKVETRDAVDQGLLLKNKFCMNSPERIIANFIADERWQFRTRCFEMSVVASHIFVSFQCHFSSPRPTRP